MICCNLLPTSRHPIGRRQGSRRRPQMLAMTEEQRGQLDRLGFVVLERFIVGEELERVLAGVGAFIARLQDESGLGPEAAVGRRGCACADPTCLELMSYDRMLPYIVDAIGWNVQLRDAILSTAAPPGGSGTASPAAAGGGTLSAAWHFDQEEEFEGVTTDTTLPLL